MVRPVSRFSHWAFVGGVGNGTGAGGFTGFSPPIFCLSSAGAVHTRGLPVAIVVIGLFRSYSGYSTTRRTARISEENAGEGLTLAEARGTREFWLILLAIALGAGCMTAVVCPRNPDTARPGDTAKTKRVAVLVTFSMVTAGWQVGMGFPF